MRSILSLFACCVAAACACSAHGQLLGTISLETTNLPDGRLRYDYLIENLSGSEFSINTLVLDVGPGADILDLEAPTDWFSDYDPLEDPFELAFVALTPEAEIPVGGSGNFSFTSLLEPGPILYYLANLDENGDERGGILELVDGPLFGPADIPGDYNGSGQVEQGDLDLVLLNWGMDGTVPPAGWVNDLPMGAIDQAELDSVLLNWGNMAPQLAGAPVPEPAAAWLVLATLAVAGGRFMRRAA